MNHNEDYATHEVERRMPASEIRQGDHLHVGNAWWGVVKRLDRRFGVLFAVVGGVEFPLAIPDDAPVLIRSLVSHSQNLSAS